MPVSCSFTVLRTFIGSFAHSCARSFPRLLPHSLSRHGILKWMLCRIGDCNGMALRAIDRAVAVGNVWEARPRRRIFWVELRPILDMTWPGVFTHSFAHLFCAGFFSCLHVYACLLICSVCSYACSHACSFICPFTLLFHC